MLIPAANVRHLMLRAGLVVYPNLDQAVELLTGMPAGTYDAIGAFPPGSVNYRVESRLVSLADEARIFLGSNRNGDA